MLSALACRLWIDVREARSPSDMVVVLRDTRALYSSFAVQGTGTTLRGESKHERGAGAFPPGFPTSLMIDARWADP